MLYVAQKYVGYPWFWIVSFLTVGLLFSLNDSQFSLLLGFGLVLGATLNYFIFGFTSAWTSYLLKKQSAGLRAQVIMLAIASILFAPLILLGEFQGQSFQGLIRPVSLSVVVGAFLFGMGMQLAGSCSSGTLNRVGQLMPLPFLTFAFLIVGGMLGAYFYGHWVHWPTLPPWSFTQAFGGMGVGISLVLFVLCYLYLNRSERVHTGKLEPLIRFHPNAWSNLTLHPWLIAGSILAVFNLLVFLISGQPWSIASIFTVWGIKLSEWMSLGLDWPFWEIMTLYQNRIERPILQDPVSLTSVGMILGAFLVTLLKGPSKPVEPVQWSKALLSIVGGLFMGFGATLSYGCNIGAFFSGIASGSLHGWVWILFAVLGNIVVLKFLVKR